MIDLFRTYGAPVMLGVVACLYVLDLRSDNKQLREDKAELQSEVTALQEQARLDAAEVARLQTSKTVIDETSAEQTERETRDLDTVRSQLTRLERSLADLKANPTPDGTLGPDVSASLSEQRNAAAAALDARNRSLRPVEAGAVPAAPKPSERRPVATRSPRDLTRPTRADAGASVTLAGGDDGMGQEGVEPVSGLAGDMASPERVPKSCAPIASRVGALCDRLIVLKAST